MNKKLTMIGLSIVVGGALLAGTAMASVSGSSGYETYKSALKNTQIVESASAVVSVSVVDQGKEVLTGNANIKADLTNEAMSGQMTMTAGEKNQSLNVYQQDGQSIIKSSQDDTYRVINRSSEQAERYEKLKNNPSHQSLNKDVENIIDLAMGNLKDYISLEQKADGTQEVRLQLSGNQITPLQNAVASLLVKNAGGQPEGIDPSQMPFDPSFKNVIPQLVDDIQVKGIDIQASINEDDLIERQSGSLTVTGKDASGNTHELIINLNLSLSDFNASTADTIDLSNKKVAYVQSQEIHQGRHGW